jgi:hypothetical protein
VSKQNFFSRGDINQTEFYFLDKVRFLKKYPLWHNRNKASLIAHSEVNLNFYNETLKNFYFNFGKVSSGMLLNRLEFLQKNVCVVMNSTAAVAQFEE